MDGCQDCNFSSSTTFTHLRRESALRSHVNNEQHLKK